MLGILLNKKKKGKTLWIMLILSISLLIGGIIIFLSQ